MARGGLFLSLVVSLLLARFPAAVQADEKKKKADEDYYELYQVLADTLDQVERNYVKDMSRRELMEAAIQGVLGKLDPYSNYISPDEISRFKTSVESQFGGIGIQITVDHGQLKILSPLVGSPAYRAGLQAGDSIVEIEGKTTEGISIDEAVRRLKGEAGTKVTLSVIHATTKQKETVSVAREVIHVDTVMGDKRDDQDHWEFMLDGDKQIGYIRLTAFSRDTAEDLKHALDNLKKRGLKGLIVDLRFNPGGLLTSAIEISDLFVAKGRIVSTKGRNTPERVWDAQQEGTYEGFPMVVLVNRFSASASEIVSACLQDHQRALVIGERTWGKGSVQNVIELEGGKSALKLTTASYLRPNGHNIHRFPDAKETDEWGVMPDKGFEVKLSDRELGDLVKYRRDRDILIARVSKPADDKTDSAKPEKSDADKPDQADKPEKPETSKPEKSDKPDEAKPAKSDKPEKSDKPDTKPEKDKPAESSKTSEAKSDEFSKPPVGEGGFKDRQLQKALDYLTQERRGAQ